MKPRAACFGISLVVLLSSLVAAPPARAAAKHSLVFATFAEDEEQLQQALFLVESVRTFAGRWKDAPAWVYAPQRLVDAQPALVAKITALRAEVRTSETPAEALRFPLASKVFAAARAEAVAEARTRVLVWMDEDTIILQEPRDFLLPKGVSLGYRPVMHNRTGSLYDRPADIFWSRVYRVLSVPESAIFPVVTPADSQTIRAYFNAGLLVVRPERGILGRWAAGFSVLYRDTAIVRMCREDRVKALFLHQVALAGAILSDLRRGEMVELSPRYNFPLFFKQMYGARREFDSIADVVTLRYDVYFQNPAPDWSTKLKGPPATIAWLAGRLGKK